MARKIKKVGNIYTFKIYIFSEQSPIYIFRKIKKVWLEKCSEQQNITINIFSEQLSIANIYTFKKIRHLK